MYVLPGNSPQAALSLAVPTRPNSARVRKIHGLVRHGCPLSLTLYGSKFKELCVQFNVVATSDTMASARWGDVATSPHHRHGMTWSDLLVLGF